MVNNNSLQTNSFQTSSVGNLNSNDDNRQVVVYTSRKRPSTATTLSTIVLRSGRTKVVIALLKSGENVDVKVSKIHIFWRISLMMKTFLDH